MVALLRSIREATLEKFQKDPEFVPVRPGRRLFSCILLVKGRDTGINFELETPVKIH